MPAADDTASEGEATLREGDRAGARASSTADIESAPTVTASASAVTDAAGERTDPSSETGAMTPAEMMRADDVARMRMHFGISVLFLTVLLIALPFLGGDSTAKWIFGGGMVAYAAVLTVYVRSLREATELRVAHLAIVCAVAVPTAYMGVYYWGIFSPAVVAVAVMVYFLNLIGNYHFALGFYLSCAVAQAALAGAIIGGLITDRGLIRASLLDTTGQILTQVGVEAALLATFLVARLSRRITMESATRLDEAARAVAQRDAMLREAKYDLDRALQIGGQGRFSGQRVGSFELGVVIGRGAMGEVYAGLHVENRSRVAVKLLHPHLLAAGQNVARFLREAEAASALRSPNVVRVLEVGGSSEQIPYIAMERLSGHDLAYHLRSERRFSTERALEVVRAVANGLDSAAETGIVHRDIKPQNVFLAEAPGTSSVWKILDFGLSKLVDSQGTLTHGDIVGTPVYMAPEQARGEPAGPAADRYSLGAIAYRMLTGHPPFNAPEVWSILHAVIHDMPRAPSRLAEIGEDVERVLLIAMAKRPEDRFESASALADALEAASADALDPALRQRADELLGAHPWR